MDNNSITKENNEIFLLKINKIKSKNNVVPQPKPNIPNRIKLIIVDEPSYEDNILLFNSIVEEAESFLSSVPEIKRNIPPIIVYERKINYNYDVFINKSRKKFGFIFDYSLTNPKNVICSTSEVTTRCMICTYKQTTSVKWHLEGKGCAKCSNRCLWYYEIFIYEAFLIHGDNFIYPIMSLDKRLLLEQYLNIVCKKCGHKWPVTVSGHIHNNNGCPKCAMEEKRWDYNKFMKSVIRIHGYKYNYSKVIPSEITSNKSKFMVSCNTCDYEWSPSLKCHINGRTGCPSCSGQAPWTYERFLLAAFNVHGYKYYYGLINPEDIQGGTSRIKLWCGKCDYYWNPMIINHINNQTGCPSCSKNEPWTYIKFIKSVQTIHSSKYDYKLVLPEDIKWSLSIINVICLTCKYQWATTIKNHINNKNNCPKCANHLSHTLETLVGKIIEIHRYNFDYSLIKQEHIKNNKSHVQLICNKCQKCWSPTINSLIKSKTGCPRCKISKGERACLNYLLSNNIVFEEQFKLLELGMKRFDFMIEHSGLKYVIEFDGVQHFKFVEYFHKLVNVFIERQEVDILKTITALKHGYNVIRIDYKQIDNISFHISEAIKLKNITYFSTPELYPHIIHRLEMIDIM